MADGNKIEKYFCEKFLGEPLVGKKRKQWKNIGPT
jgi:hypothetical protein